MTEKFVLMQTISLLDESKILTMNARFPVKNCKKSGDIFGTSNAYKAGKKQICKDSWPSLHICGFFIFDFLYMQLKLWHFRGTYPPIYKCPILDI